MAGITPSQTVGPFFHYALTPAEGGFRALAGHDLVEGKAMEGRIRVRGRVLDGEGAPVPDAMIEIWQADGMGRYAHPADPRGQANTGFAGFGRCPTDAEGGYRFETVKPGQVVAPGGRQQAPHINMTVFARGILHHLFTRIYFEGETANESDPILARVDDAAARSTLIARRAAGESPPTYVFDIHLQGDKETTFFQV